MVCGAFVVLEVRPVIVYNPKVHAAILGKSDRAREIELMSVFAVKWNDRSMHADCMMHSLAAGGVFGVIQNTGWHFSLVPRI